MKVSFKLKCGHTLTDNVNLELVESINVQKLFCRRCQQTMKVAKIIRKKILNVRHRIK